MDPSDLESALHDLWNFLTGDDLRNLLASGRSLAKLAREIYERLTFTTTVAATELEATTLLKLVADLTFPPDAPAADFDASPKLPRTDEE